MLKSVSQLLSARSSLMCAVFALALGSLVITQPRAASAMGHGMDDMMMDGMEMMKSMTKKGGMGPMVEMPSDMSMSDFPEGMVMMMDTPQGKRAFVPWYLSPQFSTALAGKGGMSKGMKMMESSGMSFAYVPWYKQ